MLTVSGGRVSLALAMSTLAGGRPRQRPLAGALTILTLAIGVAGFFPAAANGQERVAFIGVALDMETRQADRKLQDYLERKTKDVK